MILSCKYHQDLGDFESVVAKKLNSAMNKKEKTEMKNTSDILENDVGIDVSEVKDIPCENCRYRDLRCSSKPCCDCNGNGSEFKPREDVNE